MGTLTREQMAAAVLGGGSVLYAGRLITRIADLPSAADLAVGTETAPQIAADLQAQISDLQRQLAALAGPGAADAPPVEPEAGAKPKRGKAEAEDSRADV